MNELIHVKCLCCDREYKAHPMANACAYSYTPSYGCSECKGVSKKSEHDKQVATAMRLYL